MTDMNKSFEQHVRNLNLSRTDEFIIESIKLSYFSGWADAMNHLTEIWFGPTAQQCKDTLSAAVEKLQEIEQASKGFDPESDILDLSEPEFESVSMDYSKISLKD